MDLIKELEEIEEMWDTCQGDIGQKVHDLIINLQLSQQEKKHSSFAAFRLRDFVDNHFLSSGNRVDLLHIANLMDNELEFSLLNGNFSIIRAYIESYLSNGGSLPEKFLDGLWQLNVFSPTEDTDNSKTIHDYSKSIDNIVEKFVKIISSKDYTKDKK